MKGVGGDGGGADGAGGGGGGGNGGERGWMARKKALNSFVLPQASYEYEMLGRYEATVACALQLSVSM